MWKFTIPEKRTVGGQVCGSIGISDILVHVTSAWETVDNWHVDICGGLVSAGI